MNIVSLTTRRKTVHSHVEKPNSFASYSFELPLLGVRHIGILFTTHVALKGLTYGRERAGFPQLSDAM